MNRFLLLNAALVYSAACGSAEEPRPNRVPSGCEEVLRERTSGEREPDCRTSPRCEYVKLNPRRVVTFGFGPKLSERDATGVEQALPIDRQQKNWQCLASYLGAMGARVLEGSGPISVVVDATFEQTRTAFGLALINSIEVGCSSSPCKECRARDVGVCMGDPFCTTRNASLLNAAKTCTRGPQPVACIEGDRICNHEVTYAQDPLGRCWMFGSTCIPEDWQRTQECTPSQLPEAVCTPDELP
jgi:hypothetical protein